MQKDRIVTWVGIALLILGILSSGWLSTLAMAAGGIIMMYTAFKRGRASASETKLVIIVWLIAALTGIAFGLFQTLPQRTRENLVHKIYPYSSMSWRTYTKAQEFGHGFSFDIPASWPDTTIMKPMGGLVSNYIPELPPTNVSRQADAAFTLRIPSYSQVLTPDYPMPMIFVPLDLMGSSPEDYFKEYGLDLSDKNRCQIYQTAGQSAYLCHFNVSQDLDPNSPECPEYTLWTSPGFLCYLHSYPTDLTLIPMPRGRMLLIVDPVRTGLSEYIINSVKIIP